MQEDGLVTLPAVTDKNILEGLITVGDIATSYMDVHDSTVLSEARTQYRNISNAVDGRVLQGNHHGYFQEGKVAIAASGVAQMKALIEKDDLVIMGNVEELELCAVDINVSCMVICRAEKVEKEILKKVIENNGGIAKTSDFAANGINKYEVATFVKRSHRKNSQRILSISPK